MNEQKPIDKLIAARIAAGRSRVEVAEAISVPALTYRNWEQKITKDIPAAKFFAAMAFCEKGAK